jgi:hypothetical protein
LAKGRAENEMHPLEKEFKEFNEKLCIQDPTIKNANDLIKARLEWSSKNRHFFKRPFSNCFLKPHPLGIYS